MTDAPAAAGTPSEKWLHEQAQHCFSAGQRPLFAAAAAELSACRAELAKERGVATRMMNYWIYERFGHDSGSVADEELSAWVDDLKAKAERAEQSERLLAAAAKDAARYRQARTMPFVLDPGRITPIRPDKFDALLDAHLAALASKDSPK